MKNTIANCQVTLSGKVRYEESNLPVEGVIIRITSIGSEKGIYSDKDGFFSVELLKGVEHALVFSTIHTNDYHTTISLAKDSSINVLLKLSALELDEVKVVARRRLTESKIDRLVYNVANDPLAKSLTTEELMKRIPLLRIRQNSLSIVGKGNVLVSINGKLQQINSSELLPFLNNFDPSNLKSIEVITVPPSNFSAQGNAGVINIVTKQAKPSKEGNWTASARSSYSQRSLPGTDNAITLDYNKNKFSASANVNYTLTQLNAEFSARGAEIEEETDRIDKGSRIGAYVNLNYMASDTHNISASLNYYNTTNANTYTNTRSVSGILTSVGDRSNEQSRLSADLNHVFKLDTLGKSISTFISYNSNVPEERFISSTIDGTSLIEEALNSFSDLNNSAFSTQVDVHIPDDFGKLDFGVQYYSLRNDAMMQYILNPKETIESYLYDEKNYAGYMSYTTTDIGRFKFKGGLRYEYNHADLEPKVGNISVLQRRKGQLFPTLYAIYNTANGDNLSLSYAKRINRPSFSTITPFRYYQNVYTYSSGNPLIEPFISDNVQLNYSKGDLYLSLYSQVSTNGYGQIDIFDNRDWIHTYQNYFDQNRVGLTASYFIGISEWWETDLYANAYFNEANTNVTYIEDRKGYAFTYEISNRLFLDSEQRYMLSLNYWQDFPFYDNNIYNRSFGSLDLGANINFLNKKLNIGLLVTDLANQSVTKTRADYTDYSVYRREYFDAKIYRISLRYSFGSSSVKSVKSNDKFKDRDRIN